MKINSRFLEDVDMIYRTGDSYDPITGRPVEGAETTDTIKMSVQRLNMRERQLLSEGFRARDTLKLYTDDVETIQLIQNNLENLQDSAEFQVRGKRYSMTASEQWTKVIPHWKCTVVEKQNA